MPNNISYQNSSSIIENSFSDDYDSFDTDEESDEEVKKVKNNRLLITYK